MAISSSNDVSSGAMFRCRNCGSPLDVSPETIVAVCSYCGYANWIREDLKEDILIVVSLKDNEILGKARNRIETDKDLRSIAKHISVGRPYLVYIPFYFVDVKAEADYNGTVNVRVRKCTGSGKKRRCWIKSYTVHVEGHYGPFSASYPIICRRGIRAFSAKALGTYYLKNPVKPKYLSSIAFEAKTARRILSVEIDRKTAMDIALDDHLDTLRDRVTREIKRRAENKVRWRGAVVGSTILWKRITPKNIRIRSSSIIMLPLYIIPYRYRRGVYRLFLSGWDGETIVAEEPVKLSNRLLWGVGGTLAAGLLGGTALTLFNTEDLTGIIVGAIALAIGGYSSWYSLRMATRPVRVEVIGEKFRALKELGETVGKVLSVVGSLEGLIQVIGEEAIHEFLSRD